MPWRLRESRTFASHFVLGFGHHPLREVLYG